MTYSPTRAKWPFFDRLLFLLIALFIFIFILPDLSDLWPPQWLERREQRKEMIARVESSGGWVALQKDCGALAEENRDGYFFWRRGTTNALPPAIAALKPMRVQFESPAYLSNFNKEPSFAVVRIMVFGMHRTGGHSTPFYGLEVVCGPGAENYLPGKSQGGFSNDHSASYKKLTDRIYEVY